jgi:hypothetical protein
MIVQFQFDFEVPRLLCFMASRSRGSITLQQALNLALAEPIRCTLALFSTSSPPSKQPHVYLQHLVVTFLVSALQTSRPTSLSSTFRVSVLQTLRPPSLPATIQEIHLEIHLHPSPIQPITHHPLSSYPLSPVTHHPPPPPSTTNRPAPAQRSTDDRRDPSKPSIKHTLRPHHLPQVAPTLVLRQFIKQLNPTKSTVKDEQQCDPATGYGSIPPTTTPATSPTASDASATNDPKAE